MSIYFDKLNITTDIYNNFINDVKNVYSFSNNFKYVVPSGYENSDMIHFKNNELSGILRYLMINNDLHVIILGHFNDPKYANQKLDYIAANPITRGYSYAGSGLPYPNSDIAYEQTTNIGTTTIDSEGDFQITIQYPSAYYVKQGSILLNPHIKLYSKALGMLLTLDVGRPVQNRSLTGLPDRYIRTTGR